MHPAHEFPTPADAANDPRILVFGRLLGAASRLEYLLGAALEQEIGISHTTYELLLLAARAGSAGVAVRDIAQSRVLTSGGATRLVHRAVAEGLVVRSTAVDDKRMQLIRLTEKGADVVRAASAVHARNIDRYLIDVIPAAQREAFADVIRTVSKSAAAALPIMP